MRHLPHNIDPNDAMNIVLYSMELIFVFCEIIRITIYIWPNNAKFLFHTALVNITIKYMYNKYSMNVICHQCFDSVSWASGRAHDLHKTSYQQAPKLVRETYEESV